MARAISIFCKVIYKSVIGIFSCLFETRHAFSCFHIYIAAGMSNGIEFVVVDDILRYFVKFHFHVLVLFHWCSVKHVFNIDATKTCSWGGYGAVN